MLEIFSLQNNLSERCESAAGCREWRGPQYPGSLGRKGRSRATSHRPDMRHYIKYQGKGVCGAHQKYDIEDRETFQNIGEGRFQV